MAAPALVTGAPSRLDRDGAPSNAADLRRTLSAYCFGHGDPTTRVGPAGFARATLTPDGPGTIVTRWGSGRLEVEDYGPGGPWLSARLPALIGALDPGHVFEDAHPLIVRAQRDRSVRFGASGTLYHELLPVVLGQRITAGAALQQWRALVERLGEPAPGPLGLRLPPTPERLAVTPTWWFHPLGIEVKRAATLIGIARHHEAIARASTMASAAAGAVLRAVPGIGAWTVGSVLGPAFGDPDAIAVGDYHLKHVVVHALTGRARGTDEEMLELLGPYEGQRGRAVRLIQFAGGRPPKFGPRQRVLPLHRW